MEVDEPLEGAWVIVTVAGAVFLCMIERIIWSSFIVASTNSTLVSWKTSLVWIWSKASFKSASAVVR